MVGGLVQEQEVGPVREQPGERQFLPLPSAELAHGHGRIQVFQAPIRHRRRPSGCRRRGQPFQRGGVGGLRLRVCRRSRQTCRGSGTLILQSHVRLEDLADRRGDAGNVMALVEIPDGKRRRIPGHASSSRGHATRDALHERGFSGPVRAEDGDSLPGADGEGDVGEQVAKAATDGKVRYGKHGGVLPK